MTTLTVTLTDICAGGGVPYKFTPQRDRNGLVSTVSIQPVMH